MNAPAPTVALTRHFKVTPNERQAAILGLEWPLAKGWRDRLRAMRVPPTVLVALDSVQSATQRRRSSEKTRISPPMLELIQLLAEMRGQPLAGIPFKKARDVYPIMVSRLGAPPLGNAELCDELVLRHLATLTYDRLPATGLSPLERDAIAQRLIAEIQSYNRLLSPVELETSPQRAAVTACNPRMVEDPENREIPSCVQALVRHFMRRNHQREPSPFPSHAAQLYALMVQTLQAPPQQADSLEFSDTLVLRHLSTLTGGRLPYAQYSATLEELAQSLLVSLEAEAPSLSLGVEVQAVSEGSPEQEALNRIREACQQEPRLRGAQSAVQEGFIYLVTHPLFEGWVKGGMTLDYESRMVSYNVSDPLSRFKLATVAWVPDRRAMELRLFTQLELAAETRNGEWFQIGLDSAMSTFNQVCKRAKQRR